MNARRFVPSLVAALLCTSAIASASERSATQAVRQAPQKTAEATVAAPAAAISSPMPADQASAFPPLGTATAPLASGKTARRVLTSAELHRPVAAPSSKPQSSVVGATPTVAAAPPANDACVNAQSVSGPYPVTVCGTNVDATVDCPGDLDWEAVWYEVDLPYAYNDLDTDYCPGAINMTSDTIGIVYYNDCSNCAAAVAGSYNWFDCGNGNWNPKVWWRQIPGPTTILIPVYVNPAHEFCVEFNVTEATPCELACPEGGVPEAESCDDITNDGCNLANPQFEPLTCGETICGSSWATGGARDTDWFEITVTEPTTMTFNVEAEFVVGMISGLFEPRTPGVVGCDQITGLIAPYAMADDCTPTSVTYDALPGTYWWFVGPTDYNGMNCSSLSEYVATMNCTPWEVRGACCDDDNGACTDNVLYQDCPAPKRFTKDKLCSEISPPCGGCPESMLEIEIRTDRYPSETTWTVTEHATGDVVCSGGPYTEEWTTYVEYCCVGAADCVDFTINDLAGDGIWPPQGYAVRLDGVEMCSTINSGWGGFEAGCAHLGGGCEAGRCCYSPWPACADTTRFDCISQHNGLWSEGKTCADDPCQNPAEPDFEIVAPYTSPLRDNCGALNRCDPPDQYFESAEHVYRVTIPYDGLWNFNTCQDMTNATWMGLGTSICAEDLGWAAYTCNGFSAEIVSWLSAGDYYVDVEGYQQCGPYVFDVHEVEICDVACPANSTPEVEPCGDTTNNGCWMWPPAFEPIAAGQPVCGTIFADNGFDTDWYEFVASKDDTMTWTVRSNFDSMIGVAEQYVPGVAGCDNFSGTINPTAETSACADTSVSFPVVAGGTYYVYIGHRSSYNSPCGTTNDYVATLTGTSSLCGDLDADEDCDYDDYTAFLNAYGSCAGGAKYVAAADFDGDHCITALDYQHWLMCYRDFVGNPTALPTPPAGNNPQSSGAAGKPKPQRDRGGIDPSAAQVGPR